jgi:2-keto-4-pentenoate hydratase/2-oxohepta-3-ene-1,7-dioic acid hydratase in catechol pathway
MKFMAFEETGTTSLAILDGDRLNPIPDLSNDASAIDAIAEDGHRLVSESNLTSSRSIDSIDPSSIRPPVVGMEKVICIGINYADHAREMGGEPPEIPVVFNKFPSAINRPGGEVVLPQISRAVDYEAELVVVIGKSGSQIPQDDAMDYVFGYTCGNDISARDWQKGRPGGQWLLGKTFDSFAPIGPILVTADEIEDPHRLDIELRLNGETMQKSNTRQLIFKIDYLISHISRFTTLQPGDLIFSGTPSGVGAGRNPPLFLQPGDQLEVEIEGIGVLHNTVAAAC